MLKHSSRLRIFSLLIAGVAVLLALKRVVHYEIEFDPSNVGITQSGEATDMTCASYWWSPASSPQKVFDAFPLNGNLDVLAMRLEELHGVVDRFVLVESTFTYSGLSKPLHFEKNKARFARFLPKIEHIIVDQDPVESRAYVDSEMARHLRTQAINSALFSGL